ncbi:MULTISPECIES: hypothetical protein [unclassified Mesorhizobium]|uniref:hypothetical protein n=1 Tax=unclassified Mesorhizobium TaxID=325217 RepID=UPI000F760850|nr:MULTISPECIES: hypothetical protein [unclassified Mesorhizobium]AZO55200.1 hypothetical protein EJ077_18410 [Mesorhizobium sp. M8A.F.Ca.ET.057.01.1.1]RWE47324.1 MAG: hypothetical protein EOS80_11695 [Mesorhizobium sp.]
MAFTRVAVLCATWSSIAFSGPAKSEDMYSSTGDVDMSYYKHTPYFAFKADECGSSDVGSVQMSCKYIEVGTINGSLSEGQKQDPRWPSLNKYWGSLDNLLKFAGTACARSSLESEAQSIAKVRARNIVTKMTRDFDEQNLDGRLSNLGYLKHAGGFYCVKTKNTYDGQRTVSASPTVNDLLPNYKPPNSSSNAPHPRTIRYTVINDDRFELGGIFFSQQGGSWPGHGKEFKFPAGQTRNVSLACAPKEKVCYGVWRDNNTDIYWGVGADGKDTCTDCCNTCGANRTLRFGDRGPRQEPQQSAPVASAEQPSPQQSSGGGMNAAEAIDAISAGIQLGTAIGGLIGGGGSSGGGPVYIPQGQQRRSGSTITGGN